MTAMENMFGLVYRAAECFIPIDELSRDQLDRLENITLYRCRCKDCRNNKNIIAHASIAKLTDPAKYGVYRIGWSKQYWSQLFSGKMVMGIALIDAIATVLHEIIHILFIEFTEKQVREKTCEWLKRKVWLASFESMNNLPVAVLKQMGYDA